MARALSDQVTRVVTDERGLWTSWLAMVTTSRHASTVPLIQTTLAQTHREMYDQQRLNGQVATVVKGEVGTPP